MKIDIFNKIKPIATKAKFTLTKYSPEILVSVGVVGVIASTVMACVATVKSKDILETGKKEIEKIHKRKDDVEYTQHDMKKDLTRVYFGTGFKIVRSYLPSVIFCGLSLTSILSSNNILKKRTAALTAAYATLDSSFKDYRRRVIEKYGADEDRNLKLGIEEETVTEKCVDPKTGKEVDVVKKVKKSNYDGRSGYARYFDKTSGFWCGNYDYNLMFLNAQQQYANDKLQADGYLFLNDVYDNLGLPKTKAGQIVGWVYDKDNKKGDNYVEFNILDVQCEDDDLAFSALSNPVFLLDFNVDGPILDRISIED
ncbi:MAG: DUF6353 family protein [Clostridia bacterium]|nr:DUF6353 family protein [Clostridia bacterium]